MVSIWQHLPAVISALSFYLDTSALAILLDIDNVGEQLHCYQAKMR